MKSITAIILSRQPVPNKIKERVPADIHVLNFVSDIKSFKSYQRSWLMALAEVSTDWFFFFDDDDKLPPGISGIVDRAIAMADKEGAALAYTNELIINDAGIAVESRKESYSQDVHVINPLLCHHLVIGRTAAANRALPSLPRGDFMPEPMMYFQMAKEGAVWVDEIGYHWYRGAGGLHQHKGATAAQVASARWCNANREKEAQVPVPPSPEPLQEEAVQAPPKKSTRKGKEQ